MGILATLVPSQLRQIRLNGAVRGRYTVSQCADWPALLATCGREAVSVAVIDAFADGNTTAAFDWLRQLERRFPSIAVVLYVSLPPATLRDLFEAGRFGVAGLIVADQDDEPRKLLHLIEQSEARTVLQLLRISLGEVKPTVRDATLVAVGRAHERLSPDGLAVILGIPRKTLTERLVQSGFPTSQRVIAWGRLMVAARMLEDPERSADSVALALDYPSGSAFRNSCQRYLGAAPNQIRARGGARYVIDAFLRQVRRPDSERMIPRLERIPARLAG